MVYRETLKRVALLDGSGRQVEALLYVADRTQQQYAGHLPLDEVERLVRQGVGQSGANPDYVLATVDHMHAAGIPDPRLTALAERLRRGR